MIFSKNVLKAILRDIYQRKARSFTILISIAIIIAFPVGFINSGPSLTTSLDREAKDSNLSHLEIFFLSISESSISEIKNLTNPTAIEGRIRLTGIIENKLVNNQKQEVFLVSMPENRTSTVNIPKASKGELINAPGNIGILESYAEFLKVNIGDTLQVKGRNGTLQLKVTSFMKSVEFMSYDILGNGVLFINYKDAVELSGLSISSSEKIYNDVLLFFGAGQQVTTDFLKEKVKIIEDDFENDLDPFNDPQFFWFTQKTSVRSSLAEGAELTGTYLGASATFAVLVTGFIIYVIFNRYINEEKKVIGVLQSFGFNRREIIFIFVGRALTICLGSLIIGSIVAYIIVYAITSTIGDLWGISNFYIILSPISLIFFWILAFSLSLIFAIIPSYQVTKLTPYEALRERRRIHGSKKGLLEKIASFLPSIPKMSLRTLARNKVRTGLTIFSIISAMTLSIALLSALSSVNYTVDNYFENNLLFDGRIEYYESQNKSELLYIQNQSGVKEAEPNFILRTNPTADISEVVSLRGIPIESKTIKLDILEKRPDFSQSKSFQKAKFKSW
jgi:ABC-type antimicrobial peptide transport system permease subunit